MGRMPEFYSAYQYSMRTKGERVNKSPTIADADVIYLASRANVGAAIVSELVMDAELVPGSASVVIIASILICAVGF